MRSAGWLRSAILLKNLKLLSTCHWRFLGGAWLSGSQTKWLIPTWAKHFWVMEKKLKLQRLSHENVSCQLNRVMPFFLRKLKCKAIWGISRFRFGFVWRIALGSRRIVCSAICRLFSLLQSVCHARAENSFTSQVRSTDYCSTFFGMKLLMAQ